MLWIDLILVVYSVWLRLLLVLVHGLGLLSQPDGAIILPDVNAFCRTDTIQTATDWWSCYCMTAIVTKTRNRDGSSTVERMNEWENEWMNNLYCVFQESVKLSPTSYLWMIWLMEQVRVKEWYDLTCAPGRMWFTECFVKFTMLQIERHNE